MIITVRNIAVHVWEWIRRFSRYAPRTALEAAIFDAIIYTVRRLRQLGHQGVVVLHGTA